MEIDWVARTEKCEFCVPDWHPAASIRAGIGRKGGGSDVESEEL